MYEAFARRPENNGHPGELPYYTSREYLRLLRKNIKKTPQGTLHCIFDFWKIPEDLPMIFYQDHGKRLQAQEFE